MHIRVTVPAKVTTITSCKWSCPFYATYGHEMTCDHPTIRNKPDPYAGLIISNDEATNGFPSQCPY